MNKRILHLIIILLGTWGGGLGGKLLTTEAIAQGVQPGAAVANYGGAGAPGACTAGGTDRPVVYQGVLYQCVGGTYTALATSASATIAGTIASSQVAYGAGANTIQGSANLTYDGTTLVTNGFKDTALTSGRIPFVTTGGLLLDDPYLTWNNANARLGIGGTAPSYTIDAQAALGAIAIASTTGTNIAYFKAVNSGGTGFFGNEGSAGSTLLAGSTAYSLIINHLSRGIQFGTANVLRMTIDNSGFVGINAAPTSTQQLLLTPSSSSTIGQIIKLAASQSADAFEIQNSSGTVLTSIAAGGAMIISDFSAGATAQLGITKETSDSSGTMIRSLASARIYIDGYNTVFRSHTGTEWMRIWQTGVVTLTANQDIGFSRNAAGVLEINNGTAGTLADLKLRSETISRAGEQLLVLNNSSSTNLPNVTIGLGSGSQHTDGRLFFDAASSPSVANQMFEFRYSATQSYFTIGKSADTTIRLTAASTTNGLEILDSLAAGQAGNGLTIGTMNGGASTITVGTRTGAAFANAGFAPTSGGGVYNHVTFATTINQTGGANGISRLLYLNPTLTSAADFRHFEIASTTATAGTNQTGIVVGALTGATNNTHLLLGTNTTPAGTFGAYILSSAATAIPLAIKLAASQSADALQVQKSDGTVYLKVNSVGVIDLPSTTFATQYGYILKNGNRFIHDFSYGNNGTVTPTGLNLFVGLLAGNLTTGSTATNTYEASLNVGIGPQVLQNVTTGYNNMGLGAYALNQVTVGAGIVGVGANAFYQVTGSFNVGIGANVGYDLLSGTYNTFIGGNTGRGVTTGGKNTIVGAQVTGLAAGLANTVIIADGDGNKRIYIPSTGVIQINGAGTLGLYENAAGVLEINNGTAGTYRDWRARAAGLGAAPASGTQTLIITPSATTEIPLLVKQIASQTAKSFDIQNSSGTSLTSIDFNGNFFAGPSTIESFTTTSSAFSATLNYYTDSQTIYRNTGTAANDVTVNVDASASVDLNTRLAVGQAITVVVTITNGGVTAYKVTALQIHGVGQTIKWPGGTAATGNLSAEDWYTFTILKTGASTYYVTGVQTSFK